MTRSRFSGRTILTIDQRDIRSTVNGTKEKQMTMFSKVLSPIIVNDIIQQSSSIDYISNKDTKLYLKICVTRLWRFGHLIFCNNNILRAVQPLNEN